MRRFGYVLLALLGAAIFPLGIWVAAGSALYQSLPGRKVKTVSLICSIDTDCPPGYFCLNGRCSPVKA